MAEERQGPVLYEVGVPLISPITVGRAEVPPDIKGRLQLFMRPAAGSFLLQWAITWVVIIGSIWCAEYLHRPWATLLAIFIVATRQNLLALLMHEHA